MAKLSRTGKHLCCRCRKLATHKLEASSRTAPGGKLVVYHCVEHATHYDMPQEQEQSPAGQRPIQFFDDPDSPVMPFKAHHAPNGSNYHDNRCSCPHCNGDDIA
ncbi:MAG: hypothetical protein J2P37_00160 [Ktedonobacteraceae bacterium]|nr:hypothetical protein [Ktedonobacteraceae bacterium]